MYVLAIKKFRHMRNMTLEELSEKTGISVSHLSRLEADNVVRSRTTTLLTLEKIALAMEICPKSILYYDCLLCSLNDICARSNKVHYEDILEETLNFYL